MSEHTLYFKVGGMVGGSLVAGTAAGLIVWWAQDAVLSSIESKPWLLPLLGGFAGCGGVIAFVTLKTHFIG